MEPAPPEKHVRTLSAGEALVKSAEPLHVASRADLQEEQGGTQDADDLSDIIPGDRKGDKPIGRMIERERRAIDLGNLDVSRQLGDG
jgi:hypothetical protein